MKDTGFDYFKVIDSIPDGVLIIDRNFRVLAVNEAHLRLMRLRREDVLHNDWRKFKNPSNFEKVLETGESVIEVDYNDYSNTGRSNGLYVTVFPLFDKGVIVGAVTTVRDLSAIKEHIETYQRQIKRIKNEILDRHVARTTLDDIIGECRDIAHVKNMVGTVAQSDVPIMFYGESGTGKELFAQALHRASRRADQAFVAINCPNLGEQLAESELFGYEEGAFSGAKKGGKIGLFEVAHHGTIFLDEIGDLSLSIQAKILRVLETGEFYRVGGLKPIAVDCRVVCATNRNLEQMIREKTFREDLYHRLCTVVIDIPPLRRRAQDVIIIAERFLKKYSQPPKTLSPDCRAFFLRYNWPGNVRELQNAIITMTNFAEGDVLLPRHMPQRMQAFQLCDDNGVMPVFASPGISAGEEEQPPAVSNRDLPPYKRKEESTLRALLRERGYSVKAKREIARELGISLTTLYVRLKEYDIERE